MARDVRLVPQTAGVEPRARGSGFQLKLWEKWGELPSGFRLKEETPYRVEVSLTPNLSNQGDVDKVFNRLAEAPAIPFLKVEPGRVILESKNFPPHIVSEMESGIAASIKIVIQNVAGVSVETDGEIFGVTLNKLVIGASSLAVVGGSAFLAEKTINW